ncbi:MAG: hypothetical protein ACRC50_10135 [Gaiella sp.]
MVAREMRDEVRRLRELLDTVAAARLEPDVWGIPNARHEHSGQNGSSSPTPSDQ